MLLCLLSFHFRRTDCQQNPQLPNAFWPPASTACHGLKVFHFIYGHMQSPFARLIPSMYSHARLNQILVTIWRLTSTHGTIRRQEVEEKVREKLLDDWPTGWLRTCHNWQRIYAMLMKGFPAKSHSPNDRVSLFQQARREGTWEKPPITLSFSPTAVNKRIWARKWSWKPTENITRLSQLWGSQCIAKIFIHWCVFQYTRKSLFLFGYWLKN